MSGTISRARQIAEMAFEKTQSQFLDRTRALREHDAKLSERTDKTRRLRMARLEREQAVKEISSLPSKRGATPA
ncbi:hypothetical protein EBL89_19950 [Cereibacter sphaeroides]|nr:hypothetical protein EBL89_19950 [Cereibacter sphaeroides]AZB61969.1 hypothetical protein EBL88_20045 [Cereibacter sphaeroides]